MKIHKALFAVLTFVVMFLSVSLSAQDDTEDVIYLTNGTIYRGTITEQVPGVKYKIEIAGGSVIVIGAHDVLKITKETRTHSDPRATRRGSDNDEPYIGKRERRGRYEEPFEYRDKGYFFQAQFIAGFFEFGHHVINGYRFGQFGYLGLGVGIDMVLAPVNGGGHDGSGGGVFPMPDLNYDYAGLAIPLYVYYSGDILKKKIRPFYQAELGYAFRPQLGFSNGHLIGGVMGSVGFGVRIAKRGRKNISLSLNLDARNAKNVYTKHYGYGDSSESMVLLMPSLKIAIGF